MMLGRPASASRHHQRAASRMQRLSRRGNGGAERDRTAGLVIANDALSQLSYSPVPPAAALGAAGSGDMPEPAGEVKRRRRLSGAAPPKAARWRAAEPALVPAGRRH